MRQIAGRYREAPIDPLKHECNAESLDRLATSSTSTMRGCESCCRREGENEYEVRVLLLNHNLNQLHLLRDQPPKPIHHRLNCLRVRVVLADPLVVGERFVQSGFAGYLRASLDRS